jgi:hypothetical protein
MILLPALLSIHWNNKIMKKLFMLLTCFCISPGVVADDTPAADADYRSVYTSLEKCDVIESSEQETDPEIDYFTAECPGREGYRIFHIGGDSRSWIVIKREEETVIDLYNDVMRNEPGAFPFVSGKAAEWRYRGESLIALIFRIAGSDLQTQKLKSKLIVVRFDVNQACVIGGAISNEAAREIADSNKACVSNAE